MSDRSKQASTDLVTRRTALGLLGAGALVLSGCQVSPLYGDRAGFGGTSRTASALSAISIDPPNDRITQLVRNELMFGLDSGAASVQYRLALRATASTQTLSITGSGAASAQTVLVTANYQLYRLGDDRPVAENIARSTASYDSVDQRFSNQRAAIDAQARAAREVAAIVEAQLAAALATGL